MGYIEFLAKNKRLISFGFLLDRGFDFVFITRASAAVVFMAIMVSLRLSAGRTESQKVHPKNIRPY
ncbi:MAG: hypothetical protein U9O97_00245 [Elusimicrobiota bacterium]|nr:hypothetical protein [Elusimicrobiota bacterium]